MSRQKGPQITNLQTVEKLYQEFQKNPNSLDESWQSFFSGMEFSEEFMGGTDENELRVYLFISAYRKYGHLFAKVNCIEAKDPVLPDELNPKRVAGIEEGQLDEIFPTMGFLEEKEAPLRNIIDALQKIYCSRLGVEFVDVENQELREWIRLKMEPKLSIELSTDQKKMIMEYLTKADLFESFINMKYAGITRFSAEGGETVVALLACCLQKAAEVGVKEVFLGMAHRARLNVMAHILQRPYSLIFHEFESEYHPLQVEGSSDVKYHRGYSSYFETSSGNIKVHMCPNPSHLESVNPMVLGQTKGKQVLRDNPHSVLPILIHGDAAVSGQGVIYESMQMMNVKGFQVEGCIHIVINNQIGFTTNPNEGRSTRYCTDIAKTFGCPIFHVNTEDPESCIWAIFLAMEIRNRFHIDVFIDLNCYRKFGHNEGDDPSFTQPKEYKIIHSKKNQREIYRDELLSQGTLESEIAEHFENTFKESLKLGYEKMKSLFENPPEIQQVMGSAWEEYLQSIDADVFEKVDTKVSEKILIELNEKAKIPEGFHIHKKLIKWLEDRKNKLVNNKIDWALAEYLAFASILSDGYPIRLAGQDCKRGTFNQRHAVWVDQETAEEYFPLKNLSENQPQFDVFNTILCEFAALAFEYGYSLSNPKTLTLWEAQYGDFVNGAQIVIDQYITTGEMKWNRYSAFTMLLPHAYEGHGPEHSSCRLERFLQLAGNQNIQVVYPTTPAQYFHLLRKQAIRKLKKPLVILTPKSLLRHPLCISSLNDLSSKNFEELLDDPMPIKKPKKILFCSGKVFYDLIQEREKRKREDIVIIRVEQIYPFKEDAVKKYLNQYKGAKEVYWVQEEPKNMGAWSFIRLKMKHFCDIGHIGNQESASPATGSHAMFVKDQKRILDAAFE